MMLAKILKDTGIDTDKNEMILCTHKSYNDIIKDYGGNKRIIFLIRDPGDVVVSQFRELEAAKPWRLNKAPTISKFIRGVFVKEVIAYMNEWFSSLRDVKKSKIITYEEMKKDAFSVLKEVVEFVGYECDDEHIRAAVEYGSFSNMKKIEEEQIENSNGLDFSPHKLKKHGNKENPNLLRKYKGNFGKEKQPTRVRRGKVRGYESELRKDDVLYINIAKKQYLHLPLKLTLRGIRY
jgi:hypothetical protein